MTGNFCVKYTGTCCRDCFDYACAYTDICCFNFCIEIQNDVMIISERSTLSATARRSRTWLTKVSRTVHGSMPCLSRDAICYYKKQNYLPGRADSLRCGRGRIKFQPVLCSACHCICFNLNKAVPVAEWDST